MPRFCVVLSLAALSGSVVQGQAVVPPSLSALTEGTRVRVTVVSRPPGLPDTRPIVGAVRRVTADSITLMTGSPGTVTLVLTEIAKLEVSDGMRRRWKRGMGLGLAAGAATGATLGSLDAEGFLGSREAAVAIGAVVYGVIGTVAGGLIGLGTTTERWRPVSLDSDDRRLSVRPLLAPAYQGLVVRVVW